MNAALTTVCMSGGLFAILIFIHFFVDFVCQTHFEAMNKHNRPKIRAEHCFIYILGFFPAIYALFHLDAYSLPECVLAFNILFWSHFYIDTYHPVFLWAKYIRQPPEMYHPITSEGPDGYKYVSPPDLKEGFRKFVATPLGKILMIAIDQITHIIFLIPLVYMALN